MKCRYFKNLFKKPSETILHQEDSISVVIVHDLTAEQNRRLQDQASFKGSFAE